VPGLTERAQNLFSHETERAGDEDIHDSTRARTGEIGLLQRGQFRAQEIHQGLHRRLGEFKFATGGGE
jgi:hypothetical protein